MSTFTAQILVGTKHSYDGGIINVSHILYLSENSRPAWVLSPTDVFNENGHTQKRITWIPTLENMLEDALVMIGLYVLKDEKLVSLANDYFDNPKQDFLELHQDIQPEGLQELYNHTRLIKSNHKMILSVFQGSTLLRQLSVLEQFQNDIEVCKSIFTKEYSLWTNQFETYGTLD